VIAGPTAVGKTAVALQVAQHFNTVIISADSRQCYKELNIGVARPSEEELAFVPHYFIASHSIHDDINAAWYENYALELLKGLFKKHEVVVVAGGTGLYIKALLEGMDEIPTVPYSIRQSIAEHYEVGGMGWLQSELQKHDPLFAATGEMQNPRRMMRALEVWQASGVSILNFRNRKKEPRNFNVVQIGLEMHREILYDKINKRVDAMMEAGLENEAQLLLPYRHLNALQTVGYSEMFDYFDGNLPFERAVELIKQNTRHYAKRQMTWFKKDNQIEWMDARNNEKIVAYIKSHFDNLKK
jgi:tRNA dimethylallyltransferase